MEESKRLARSKKKGTRNLDENMVGLGFKRIADKGDVVMKFQRMSP